MKTVKQVVVGLVWCVVSVGCVAEDAQQSTEPAKPILKFKLMTGEQYPLCKDYVDMLNKTQYTEIPVCERKVLPGFSKFKAVEWTEITDKEEIRKMMKEEIRLKAWSKTAQEKAGPRMQEVDKNTDAGEYPRTYKAKADMDHDGNLESVYQFSTVVKAIGAKLYCSDVKSYLVIDSTNEETEKGYRMPHKKYGITYGGVDIFYYDGRIFQSYFESVNAKYQFEVNEISGIPDQVCGINIIP